MATRDRKRVTPLPTTECKAVANKKFLCDGHVKTENSNKLIYLQILKKKNKKKIIRSTHLFIFICDNIYSVFVDFLFTYLLMDLNSFFFIFSSTHQKC